MTEAAAPWPQRLKMPHTLVLVWLLVAIVLAASWVVPAGEFGRSEVAGRQVPVPGTYHTVAKVFLGPETLLLSPIKGFIEGAFLIAFLLVIGGSFNVLQDSGAVEFGIARLTRAMAGRPALESLVIPALMVTFSLAGSVFGMAESMIPFVVIFIPLARNLGYDSIVGASIPFLGAAAGFAAAFLNPFTVGIAQQLAGLPANSGLGYRVFTWFVGTTVIVAFVVRYARKVKKNPELSPVRDLDLLREAADHGALADGRWDTRHVVTLVLFGVAMAGLVGGILKLKWDIGALAAYFLGMGVVLGLSAGLGPSRIATAFVAGAKNMVGVVFIVACARALLVIGRDAKILDTALQASYLFVSALPRGIAAHLMFAVQCVINFFLHSGTAQAALTMPILAPLSDLVGVTRQTCVYAFQLCEFINPILPTSAVTMGVLGAAGIPWERWARWFLPLMLILVALSVLLLIPPVFLFRYGPF